MADSLPRKLPAILYADVAGYGRLTSRSSGKSRVSYGTIVGRVSVSKEWQKEMADNNKTAFFLGCLLIAVGIICNKWILQTLFAPDGHIDYVPSILTIALFQISAIGMGLSLISRNPLKNLIKWLRRFVMILGALSAGPILAVSCGNVDLDRNWRTADRSSAGIAPVPQSTPEAVVQVYAARAYNWRGALAVHTWIATKPRDGGHYTVHDVIGWRRYGKQPVMMSMPGIPDRLWFGSRPELLVDLRGEAAAAAIPRIEAVVASYPYDRKYHSWPGPNSNTFTAHVGRHVPELVMDLPTTAIGKDFLTNGSIVESAPSGTGGQLSLYGLLGVTVAREEGLELNILALNFGIDVLHPAIKLPGIGRIGMSKTPQPDPPDH